MGRQFRWDIFLLKMVTSGFLLGEGEGIRPNLGIVHGRPKLLRRNGFFFGWLGTTPCPPCKSYIEEVLLSQLTVLGVEATWRNLFYTV